MKNIESLRIECARLFMCKTIQDSIDLLDIYAEFLFQAIMKNHETQHIQKQMLMRKWLFK